ncbi:hypothetical protein [Ruminiclostridium josui]|uniref:hypothetical protein n=1 Tax=Ruminiclostridium josui TaxID=1499 RepID=UPI000467562C|nr:hypothetical protein [Ruminiclostridium josui]
MKVLIKYLAKERRGLMSYWKHLKANWIVAAHALRDCFAHAVHGLIPCVKIKHHQPVKGDIL